MTERSRWTDERMDDFVAHITARFDQVDARFAEIDRRFHRLEMRVDRLSWLLAGVLVTQLVALAITGFIATQV